MTTGTPALPRHSHKILSVVDSHTCGQPTRVIINGLPIPAGMTPTDTRQMVQGQWDWMRRLAVFEPRGHRSMFAAALIPPEAVGGVHGVLFMDANGYPDMCGHATIGTATTLIELGLVGPEAPDFTGTFEFPLDTPAGRLHLRASLDNGRCVSVAFRSPGAYHVGDVTIEMAGRPVVAEVAYGGQYYAFVPVEAAGLAVEPDAIDALIAAAAPVRDAIARQGGLIDPRTGLAPTVGNIVWVGTPEAGKADGLNVPVSSSNSFDRSPCGTATCARMAALVAKGRLDLEERFVNQGIMGTLYVGRAFAPQADDGTQASPLDGIVPEVEGSAWITARSDLLLDPADPLGHGYLIANGPAIL
ncbi:MAG: proline racemase family protein [Sphingobium sp.]